MCVCKMAIRIQCEILGNIQWKCIHTRAHAHIKLNEIKSGILFFLPFIRTFCQLISSRCTNLVGWDLKFNLQLSKQKRNKNKNIIVKVKIARAREGAKKEENLRKKKKQIHRNVHGINIKWNAFVCGELKHYDYRAPTPAHCNLFNNFTVR